MSLRQRVTLVMCFALLAVAAVQPVSAEGTLFFVNTFKDTPDAVLDGICADAQGRCSLRAAIQEANATEDEDTILLQKGTYKLKNRTPGEDENAAAEGDLDIHTTIEIIGAGAGKTIITAKNKDRIFDIHDAWFELSDLTLTKGKTSGDGGCIRISGEAYLEIYDAELTKCTAGENGGAIRAENGALVFLLGVNLTANSAWSGGAVSSYLVDFISFSSIFKNNTAVQSGGAVHVVGDNSPDSSIVIYDSQLIQNRTTATSLAETYGSIDGGALLAENVNIVIAYSTFFKNSTAFWGGGAELAYSAFEIVGSVFQQNSAGESGGGLYIYEAFPGEPMEIMQSSFVNNTVTGDGIGGGIILDGGSVNIYVSTISGNKARDGAGIHVNQAYASTPSALSLSHVTIAANKARATGGGLMLTDGTVEMAGSILAENSAPTNPDCVGSVTANYTIIGSTSGCTIDGGDNLTDVVANLGPLTYYDPGVLPVHVPNVGSPAIGFVDVCGEEYDQRNMWFPEFNCEAGSVQVDRYDLIKNGNFENGLANWSVVTTTGSKVAGKKPFTGVKSFKVKGGGSTTLTQQIKGAALAPLVDGSLLEIGAFASINPNIPVKAKLKAVVKYSDGTADKQTVTFETTCGCWNGFFTEPDFIIDLQGGTRTVKKVKVQIADKTTKKSWFLDYVVAVVYMDEPLRSGPSFVLPPPAAPDGFRTSN